MRLEMHGATRELVRREECPRVARRRDEVLGRSSGHTRVPKYVIRSPHGGCKLLIDVIHLKSNLRPVFSISPRV